LVKVTSFDQVLNHFKAVYFASAILVNKKSITRDLKTFFDRETWNGEAFLDLRSKYNVSPEIMLARLTITVTTRIVIINRSIIVGAGYQLLY